MVTYHGVTAKVYWQRIAAEGKIIQEYIGTLTGNTAEQVLYTKSFPITTNAGVATDLETEVDVYTRPAAGGSTFTELNDNGNDFDILGASGTVTIEEAANQAPDAGKTVSISYYTMAELGCAQGMTIETSRPILEVRKMGQALAQELKAGHISIAGSIRDLYTHRDLMGKILSRQDYYGTEPDFSLYLYPNGVTPGEPRIKCGNVMAAKGSLGIALDALLNNDVDFKAIALTIDVCP